MQKNMNFAVRDEKTALNLERQEKSDPLIHFHRLTTIKIKKRVEIEF